MQLSSYTKLFTAVFCAAFITACSNSNDTKTTANETAGTSTSKATPTQASTTTTATGKVEDGPAVATLETELYTAKIHRVIPVTVKQDAASSLFKVKDGHQYIVLDMSIKNKSGEELDMGQIMLGAKITDETGKDVSNLMSIAAYTYANPNPIHQPQYEALWGKMKPGDFNRTTVLGMEAPKTAKTFKLSMKTKPDFFDDKSRQEITFTL